MSKLLEMAKELLAEVEKREGSADGKVTLSEIPVGGKFVTDIGKFIVLGQAGDYTKVVTEDLYRKNVQFDSETTDYTESELRELCDGEIYEEFENVFGADNIIGHEVDLTTVDMQRDFGTYGCKVRPLTFDEARQYNGLIVNTELPDWYWTCTAWSTKERGWQYCIAVVAPAGDFDGFDCDGCFGVRPVCILKSNISVSKED